MPMPQYTARLLAFVWETAYPKRWEAWIPKLTYALCCWGPVFLDLHLCPGACPAGGGWLCVREGHDGKWGGEWESWLNQEWV